MAGLALLATIAWTAAERPGTRETDGVDSRAIDDKLVHVAGYAALASATRDLGLSRPWSVGAPLAVGVIQEIGQAHVSAGDLVADAAGALLGSRVPAPASTTCPPGSRRREAALALASSTVFAAVTLAEVRRHPHPAAFLSASGGVPTPVLRALEGWSVAGTVGGWTDRSWWAAGATCLAGAALEPLHGVRRRGRATLSRCSAALGAAGWRRGAALLRGLRLP